MTGEYDYATARDTYLMGVLDHITSEAWATKGTLRSGVAVALLIADRHDRLILTDEEAIRVGELAADTGGVCINALITRRCPRHHEWAIVTTPASETFDLPFKGPAHP